MKRYIEEISNKCFSSKMIRAKQNCLSSPEFPHPIGRVEGGLCDINQVQSFLPSTFHLLSSTFHLPSSIIYLLSSILFLLPSTLFPTILTVKQDGTGQYMHIQDAIDAAAMHDTVLVWPGTYYENLHIASKPITLASLYLTTGDKQYTYQTIIDGSNELTCVIALEDFPAETTGKIIGFTIQNGKCLYVELNSGTYVGYGGGIFNYYADLEVSGCLIQDNVAWRDGGGIKAMFSSLYISHSTIRNNRANLRGGGIWFAGGDFFILDTAKLNNIYCNHSIMGNDFFKHIDYKMDKYIVDTSTTIIDHGYCIYNSDDNGAPVYDIELIANHAIVDQVEADVFVSPDGDNANSGLTPDTPLKNIWYAMTKIKPDTNTKLTIHVFPGTYSPSSNAEIFPINARNNSVLMGEDMETCIFDAEETWFHYSCHSMTYGMELRNLTFVNGNSITNLDNRFKPGSIDLSYSHFNYTIENLLIKNNKGLSSSACRLLTRDNMYLNDISASGNFGGLTILAYYSAEPVRRAIVARNISVTANQYYGTGFGFNGGGLGFGNSYTEIAPLIASVSGILVCNNLVYDSWGGADFLSCFSVNGRKNNISNVTLANNQNEGNLPGAYSTWDNKKSYMYNAIFYGNEHPSIVLGVEPPLENPGELYIDYSLIELGITDIWNQYNYNILHYGTNNIEGNPLFKETGAHPYQLQAGSPCIDAGTPMYQPGMQPPYIKEENGKYVLHTEGNDTLHLPATDLAGNPRITGSRIDMGAYEYNDSLHIGMQQRPPLLGSNVRAMPNPMQESTSIQFTLLASGHCEVKIHDLQGQFLTTIMDAHTQPGNFKLRWHGTNNAGNKLPAGHYLISVTLNGKTLDTVKVWKVKV